jgi:hypothetical protein
MASLWEYLLGGTQSPEPDNIPPPPPARRSSASVPAVDARGAAGATAAGSNASGAPSPVAGTPPASESTSGAEDVAVGTPPIATMHATLVQQQGFNTHMSALASRTELAPEDVMAEALRFANRHQDAFHDFIYKGQMTKVGGERAGTGHINNIVAMVFLLGLLVTLIVILGTR